MVLGQLLTVAIVVGVMIAVTAVIESVLGDVESPEDVESVHQDRSRSEPASPSDPSTVHVGENEALGIVVEGEPGGVYESGRHEITPFTSDGRHYDGEDWRTVRFATGRRLVTVTNDDGERTTTSSILVEVRDPAEVWQRAPDIDEPVESLVFDTGNQLTDEDEAIGDLSLDRLAPTLAEDGLCVRCTGARRTRTESYELETLTGEQYEVSLELDETVRKTGPDSEHDVLATLRDGIQEVADSESSGDHLDATTLEERLDGEPGVSVIELRPLETDPELEQESERVR